MFFDGPKDVTVYVFDKITISAILSFSGKPIFFNLENGTSFISELVLCCVQESVNQCHVFAVQGIPHKKPQTVLLCFSRWLTSSQ